MGDSPPSTRCRQHCSATEATPPTQPAQRGPLVVRVGDEVDLVVGERSVSLHVTGILGDEGPASVLDGGFVLMDIAAAQWAVGRLGRVDRVDVRLGDGIDVARAERSIASRLPAGITVRRPSSRGAEVERMLRAFQFNLTALSLIALIVGLFLVYNTVSVSVITRRGEIGMLRTLGVTRRAVVGLFLGEAGAPVLDVRPVRGTRGQVSHLLRIAREVEIVFGARTGIPDVLPPAVGQVLHPAAQGGDDRAFPVQERSGRGGLAPHRRHEARALDGIGNLDPGDVEQRGHQVHEFHQFVPYLAALPARVRRWPEHEGDARGTFEGVALADPLVVAQHLAVIGDEHHDGVERQGGQDTADLVVDVVDRAVVAGPVLPHEFGCERRPPRRHRQPALGLVAKMRFLRGTSFDPFGHTAERRRERRLIKEYFETVEELLAGLRPENLGLAVEIASIPEAIRGYGHVKARAVEDAESERAALLERWRARGGGETARARAA